LLFAAYIAPKTLRCIDSLSILRSGNSHETMLNRIHPMSYFAEAALAVQAKPCPQGVVETLARNTAHALAGRRAG
jgi:hypothetical protein